MEQASLQFMTKSPACIDNSAQRAGLCIAITLETYTVGHKTFHVIFNYNLHVSWSFYRPIFVALETGMNTLQLFIFHLLNGLKTMTHRTSEMFTSRKCILKLNVDFDNKILLKTREK